MNTVIACLQEHTEQVIHTRVGLYQAYIVQDYSIILIFQEFSEYLRYFNSINLFFFFFCFFNSDEQRKYNRMPPTNIVRFNVPYSFIIADITKQSKFFELSRTHHGGYESHLRIRLKTFPIEKILHVRDL